MPCKLAICLFGQPRRYQLGFQRLSEFIKLQTDVTVDFYFHTWIVDKPFYDASPHRNLPPEELKTDTQIIEKLIDLYRPVEYAVDSPSVVDVSLFDNTLLLRNTTHPTLMGNIRNTLSQFHSRQRVRDLLKRSGRQYDFVVCTRFDFPYNVTLLLHELIKDYIYLAGSIVVRRIPDWFILSNQQAFLDMQNLLGDFDKIKNNKDLEAKVLQSRCVQDGNFCLNPEELLLSTVVYYNHLDKIVYTEKIPNFVPIP